MPVSVRTSHRRGNENSTLWSALSCSAYSCTWCTSKVCKYFNTSISVSFYISDPYSLGYEYFQKKKKKIKKCHSLWFVWPKYCWLSFPWFMLVQTRTPSVTLHASAGNTHAEEYQIQSARTVQEGRNLHGSKQCSSRQQWGTLKATKLSEFLFLPLRDQFFKLLCTHTCFAVAFSLQMLP